MRDYAVFDLETAKTTKEVQQELDLDAEGKAFGYPHRMMFGCGIVWDSKQKLFVPFKKADEMADFLLGFDGVLVSWNGRRFDIPVLLPFIDIDVYNRLQAKPHLDMLQDFYERVQGRFRISLDNCAKHTVGVGKIGDGADAPLLFKQGRWEELLEYCKVDVSITKRILEYGLEHGHIKFWDKFENQVVRMPVGYEEYLK
jgi:DEAD/DEAH box helicase domain-containing protein